MSFSTALQRIKNHTRVVTPSPLAQVTSDPDDNIFVECADAARADYLGDGQPAPFPFWKNTKIISPKAQMSFSVLSLRNFFAERDKLSGTLVLCCWRMRRNRNPEPGNDR